jgi:hypothetical protein
VRAALREDAPLLCVAAGGFEPGFVDTANRDGRPVFTWMLQDLFEP